MVAVCTQPRVRRRPGSRVTDGSLAVDTKRVTSILAIVFIVFFIIQSPADAADIAHSIGHGVAHAFDQLSVFFKNLD